MRTLLALAVLVSCCACGNESPIPPITINPYKSLVLELQGGDRCITYLDGQSANTHVRTLEIQNRLIPGQTGPTGEDRVVRLTVPTGLTVEAPTLGWTVSPDGRVIEGEIKAGETLVVPVFFANIAPGQPAQMLDVKLESLDVFRTAPLLEDVIAFDFHSRPADLPQAALDMLQAAGLPSWDLVTHDVEKPRYESSWTQQARVTEPVTDIVAHTTTKATVDAQKLADLLALFPPGVGPWGLTVPAEMPATPQPGEWVFLTTILDAPIPLAPAQDEFQYVFASTQDTDAGNDYVTPLGFPGDTFRNTDLEFALGYGLATGWTLRVTDTRTGLLTEIPNAAWVTIRDNALLWAIPPGLLLPDPDVFLSAFRHDGTWGQQAPFDWSMDYVPLRGDEPAQPIGTPPSAPGSPEAQAFDGSWRLEGTTDYCVTIVDGTLTTISEGCTTPLPIAESVPGATVTPSLVRWEVRLTDGRRIVITQNVDTSVPMDTALDIYSSPSDTLGVRTFPDLVAIP